MAKGEKEKAGELEQEFQLAGDWLSIIALLFSIFISFSLILLLFLGGSWLDGLSGLFSALRVYVFPWIIALGLLSIGREFWAIRVYLQHIHLGSILEKRMEAKR